MPGTATAEALIAYDGLDDARAIWESLEAQTGNPFATWAYAATWYRHLGAGRPLRVAGARDAAGRLFAILPLYEAAGGERPTLRLLGHTDADLLGPVCAPADREAALEALVTTLGDGPVRLIADDVLAGSAAVLGGTVTRHEASPVLDLDDSFEALLARLTRNHRQQIRTRERRLRRSHSVTIRVADPSTLEGDLETLMALHRARWGAASRVYDGPRIAMHREHAADAMSRGWLRIRVLEVDGRAVAANYALRHGHAEAFYQAGRDPSWRGSWVGAVLQAACIRSAIEEGATTYRWLRGAEPYKLRWPCSDEPLETVVVERG